jgi:single-stranded-DNA-specific exonuclease
VGIIRRPRLQRRPAVAGNPLGGVVHPLLARLYAARGIDHPGQIDHRLVSLHHHSLLGGLEDGAALLELALDRGWQMVVVGDFDADGATGTALLVRTLRWLGGRVSFLVPDRFRFGYGLSPEIVAEVARVYDPALLITVDNGISSLEGVAEARRRGMRVIVTDHHLPGPELPQADVIINPNQPGDPFPAKSIAGVGVALYLMMALRARLRQQGWFDSRGLPEPNLGRLLDLVALGTVADVVALDQNNRVLVANGLERLRSGHGSAGVAALAAVAGRSLPALTASDLGFALGPRLNAAGRMEQMGVGIECLLSESATQAESIAVRLDDLNSERREVEAKMKSEALEWLDRMAWQDAPPVAITLYESGWHQGVIGILAARVRERYHRPVFVFADAGDGELKGSGRSIPGLHLRDLLASVDRDHPGLLLRYGGHAMAAGLTIRHEHLSQFRDAVVSETARQVDDDLLQARVLSDGRLTAEELTIGTALELERGGPWGQGFSEPLFDDRFELLEVIPLRGGHSRCRLRLPGETQLVEGVAFGVDESAWPAGEGELHLAYRLAVNRFRGNERLQLMVEQIWPGSLDPFA